jgi:hypothetical protein
MKEDVKDEVPNGTPKIINLSNGVSHLHEGLGVGGGS